MDVGGVGVDSVHEQAEDISSEQKCINRRANKAEGDGSVETLDGSSRAKTIRVRDGQVGKST